MSTPAKKPVPAAPALPFQVGEIETEGRRSRGTASIEFDTSDRRGRSIGTNEFDVSGGRKRTNASVVEQTEAGATRGRSTVTADPVWANHQAKSQREREPSVIDPDVIKMGWIQRYSKPKLTSLLANPWKQQWFVLGLGRLAYFARPGENECLGVIDLDGYHVEVLDDPTILRQVKRDRRQVCLFRLTHPKKREYIFCAENEPDLEEWVECILLEVFREKVSAMSAPPSKDQKPKPVSAEKIAKREISLRRMSREAGLVIAPLAPGTPVAAAKSGAGGDSSIQTVTDDNFDWDAQINAVNTSRSTRGTREAVVDETGAGRAARGRSAVVADDFEAGRVQRGRSQHVNEADVMPEGRSTRGRTAVMDGSAPGPQSQSQPAATTTTSPPPKPAESTPAPAKTPTASAVAAAHKEKPALERSNSKVQCDVFEPHMWKKTQCVHCGRAEGEHTGGRKQESKSTSAPAQVATGATSSLVQKHREELERKEKEYRSQREQQTKNMMQAIHEKEERMAKRRAEREQRERDAAEKRKKFEDDMQKQKEKEEAAKRIADQAERAKREQELAAARQAREAQRKKEEAEEKAREEARLKQVAEEKAKKQKEREERRKQRQEEREKKRKAAEAAAAASNPTPATGAPASVKAEVKDQPATKPALKVNTEAKEAPQVLVAEDSEDVTVPTTAAPEVKTLVEQLLDLQKSFGALSDDQCAQKGSQSYAELKNFVPKIQQLREAHGDDVNVAVKLYNRLNKSIPKRVNEVLQKVQEQRLKAAAAAAEAKATNDGTCQVCHKPLTGSTVEALGGFFHVECFKCTTCQRPFVKTCLNIEGKPYCDGCGRRAFVQAKLRNKAKAEGK